MFLLDTNVCIRLLNRTSSKVAERLAGLQPSQVRLCSVVKAELCFGARKSSRPSENLRLLDSFFEPFVSEPFDDRCAEPYAAIRQDLERSGRPIGANDLLIASIALAHELTLVTHNIEEFSRVIGLRYEDWET